LPGAIPPSQSRPQPSQMGANPFKDLDALRLTPEQAAAGQQSENRKTGRRRHQFIKVPRVWSDRLLAARYISTYRLAHYLLFHHWKTEGRTIPLSNVAAAGIKVSRVEKWRALRELEHLELIQVVRRKRKSPLITVLID
jgi:hypothetical protein